MPLVSHRSHGTPLLCSSFPHHTGSPHPLLWSQALSHDHTGTPLHLKRLWGRQLTFNGKTILLFVWEHSKISRQPVGYAPFYSKAGEALGRNPVVGEKAIKNLIMDRNHSKYKTRVSHGTPYEWAIVEKKVIRKLAARYNKQRNFSIKITRVFVMPYTNILYFELVTSARDQYLLLKLLGYIKRLVEF